MEEKRLDCCVVRDLLPAYLEGLTEEETGAQVARHLEECPACREMEGHMAAQVPMDHAPKGALNFLKRVRRTRLVGAAITIVLCLWCIWWLYERAAFNYPNTEAGRLAAVTDYVLDEEGEYHVYGIPAGTPIKVLGWVEIGDDLHVGYAAQDRERTHGILHLKRGLNGKYRPMVADLSPFPYTAGVEWGVLRDEEKGVWGENYYLMGSDCREIYAVELELFWSVEGESWCTTHHTFQIDQPDFLIVVPKEELEAQLEEEPWGRVRNWASDIRLLDKEGNDVTDQYRDDTVADNWGGSRGTAEAGLLYFYIFIVTGLGVIFVRYFLRKD